ncbi:hypothetical protein VCHENC02_1574A, partial [Vibrio harveyi]
MVQYPLLRAYRKQLLFFSLIFSR